MCSYVIMDLPAYYRSASWYDNMPSKIIIIQALTQCNYVLILQHNMSCFNGRLYLYIIMYYTIHVLTYITGLMLNIRVKAIYIHDCITQQCICQMKIYNVEFMIAKIVLEI